MAAARRSPLPLLALQWMAPEQMRGARRKYSYKSDVFSYAVLLTELCGNTLPFPGVPNVDAAISVCTKKARTPIPARTPPLLREVIERGWEQDPADRPTMDMVVRWLVQQRVDIGVNEDEYCDAQSFSGSVANAYDDVENLQMPM